MRTACRFILAAAVTVGLAGTARAQTEDDFEIEKPMAPPPEIRTAVADGVLLPSTLSPRVGANAALALGFAGYDGARSTPIGSATAEVRVWARSRSGRRRVLERPQGGPPHDGGRVQLLRQNRHGVDGSVSVFYRPEGFTEPEGEIESFVSLGRRGERVSVFGNLVYGQDPEGNERDGEVRFASL